MLPNHLPNLQDWATFGKTVGTYRRPCRPQDPEPAPPSKVFAFDPTMDKRDIMFGSIIEVDQNTLAEKRLREALSRNECSNGGEIMRDKNRGAVINVEC